MGLGPYEDRVLFAGSDHGLPGKLGAPYSQRIAVTPQLELNLSEELSFLAGGSRRRLAETWTGSSLARPTVRRRFTSVDSALFVGDAAGED